MPLFIVHDLGLSPAHVRPAVLPELPDHRGPRDPVERRHRPLVRTGGRSRSARSSPAPASAPWRWPATSGRWRRPSSSGRSARCSSSRPRRPTPPTSRPTSGAASTAASTRWCSRSRSRSGPWAGTVVLERAGARVLWGLTFVLGVIAAAMFLRLPRANAPSRGRADASGRGGGGPRVANAGEGRPASMRGSRRPVHDDVQRALVAFDLGHDREDPLHVGRNVEIDPGPARNLKSVVGVPTWRTGDVRTGTAMNRSSPER